MPIDYHDVIIKPNNMLIDLLYPEKFPPENPKKIETVINALELIAKLFKETGLINSKQFKLYANRFQTMLNNLANIISKLEYKEEFKKSLKDIADMMNISVTLN